MLMEGKLNEIEVETFVPVMLENALDKFVQGNGRSFELGFYNFF